MLADACLAARYAVDWRDLQACEFALRRALASGDVQDIAAFHGLLLPINCSLQLGIASEQAMLIAASASDRDRPRVRHHRRVPASSSLRVAFLRGSANSNAERLTSLLSLDPRRFAVHMFTSSRDVLSIAVKAAPGLRHQSLSGVDDPTVAHLLAGYDLVLDGGGHTAGHRLPALARHPTPVATSVLGFPSSYGGAGLVDYLTADRQTSPPHLCALCVSRSERLSLLPTTYQVVGAHHQVLHSKAVEKEASQEEAEALPEEWRHDGLAARRQRWAPPLLLIGSFTRCVRWHPDSFGLWAAVLLRSKPSLRMTRGGSKAATTAAALWLLADSPAERSSVSGELGAVGVWTQARLVFAGWQPRKDVHLARHRTLSLSLDTTPLYGSHTTAADALQSSVPLLTLPADTWASRVGASVASAAGAPETVVASHKGFVDLADALLAPSPPSSATLLQLHHDRMRSAPPAHAALPSAWQRRAIELDPSSRGLGRFG